MKKNAYLMLLALLALVSLVVLPGCVEILTPAPRDYPYELMLSASDLPPGWERLGGSFPDVPGEATTNLVAYAPTVEVSWKMMSHRIAVYSDPATASKFLEQWEQRFTPAWQPVEQEVFQPTLGEDYYRFEYLDVSISGEPVRSYTYLQQHENLIILVLANEDGEDITLDLLLDVLGKLDARLQTYTP